MSDLMRIGSNTQAMKAIQSSYNINKQMAIHQARLSTGKRINSAEDDTAGYAIARSLEARTSGLNQALDNVSNARSILSIAEGGYQAASSVMDLNLMDYL